MPSLHPQAKFDPVPPDFDLHDLVPKDPERFKWVPRISATQIRHIGVQKFEKLVSIHVIQQGRPLVIENWGNRLPRGLFSAKWLEDAYNKKQENVWDVSGQSNIPMTMGHYLRSMKQLTDQWTPNNFRDERRQRLYLKDIDCPVEWHDHLQKILPPGLFYLNENVEDRGGQHDDMYVDEQTPAPAGDLMSSLPEDMRAQNLMCYIGHEGTYTPAHREMCASVGHNIMVEASRDEHGEKEGSSIWFMTETKDREVVREYFLSMLGHDVEIEKHFAQINAWKKATFTVYFVEQKVGDFILVPPLAPHQVWNRGTRTMKVAWNRTTAETLEMALHEALPKARLVCRDEQYKNKAVIYFTLQKYYKQLLAMEDNTELALLGFSQSLVQDSLRMQQITAQFKTLLKLYTEILVDEMFSSKEKNVEYLKFDSNITCSYCRANIFNRFLTCKHCVRQLAEEDGEDTYDVCMECYAMGRSCVCISGLSWCEQWRWGDLVDKHETWRTMVIKNDGFVDVELSPPPLEIARRKTGKKSVAQICQEQLRRRPFKDITKPEEKSDLEPSEPDVDADGKVIKKRKKRREKKGEVYRCHVCSHKEHTFRLAFCSTPGCSEAYCFGVLYRGFDMMPQAVLQQENWTCPKCMNICNCSACRRTGRTEPYIPKTTHLGHDTRKVADDRSVESLVDLRIHNLGWLKNVGEEGRSQDSKRMQRLRQQADAEKAKDTDPNESAAHASLMKEHGGGAPEATMQPSATNGYVVQTEILGHDSMPQVDGSVSTGGLNEGVADFTHDQAEVASISLAEDVDQSSYPDPSGFHDPFVMARGLGLGYYQQDDSPDKILFDPYSQPSADAAAAEEEASAYLKKTLRAAKRMARLETGNDPDFSAPRSNYRKLPRPDQDASHDFPIDLDPALLGEDTEMQEATVAGPGLSSMGNKVQPEIDAGTEDDIPPSGARYEANVPALRHAKPKLSYLEIDDGANEFIEALPFEEPRLPTEPAAPASNDPLDLASDAIRAITGGGPALAASEVVPPATQVPKRRGRPKSSDVRKSSRISDKKEVSKGEPAKKKGRMSHTSMLAGAGLDRSTLEDGDAAGQSEGGDHSVAGLGDSSDDDDNYRDGSLETRSLTKKNEKSDNPKKRRGRPPKNAAARDRTEESESPPPPPADTRFMSMAQRLALQGKKFKFGQRKSGGKADKAKASPAATIASVEIRNRPMAEAIAKPAEERQETAGPKAAERDDSVPGAARPLSSMMSRPTAGARGESSTPARRGPPGPSQKKAAAPTVVRLTDSDNEDGSPPDSSSDDDEDIPARLPDRQPAPDGSDSDSSSGDNEDIPARLPVREPARAFRGRRGGRGRGGWAIRGRAIRGRAIRGGRI